MRTRSTLIALSGELLLQAALAAGLLASCPPALRVVLTGITLLLVPGFAWLKLLHARPPGGPWLAPGWALGLGVAWNAVLLSLCAIARVPFTHLATALLPANALLWAVVLARRSGGVAREVVTALERETAPLAGGHRESAPEAPAGAALALTMLAALCACAYAARLGAPLHYVSDSPDHVGTIRRMLEHGVLFPNDAFFRDAGGAGVDPRKFLWHGEAALIAVIARVTPLVAWRDLPILLSPLLILNVAAFGALLAGGPGAAFAAWALLLTYGGSLASTPMRETVYAAKLADHLALATAVAVLADLARPSRGTRLAAAALAIGAVAAHVFAALQFAIVFSALAAGLALRERGIGPSLRRLIGTALAVGGAVAPFALWQLLRTPAPVNPIHTEAQGLLTLWDGVRVVSPGVLWDWMGSAWLLFPMLTPRLWREGRGDAAALFLLTTAAAVGTILFVPPVVSVLQPRVGYLLMRVVWMTPLAALVAWALPRLIADLRSGAPRARGMAAAQLGAVALLLAPALLDAARVARHSGEIAADERRLSPLVWRADLEWMDAHLPRGSVVLSDPLTSYAVPMMTHDYVVTLLDQHSSPSDPQALRRLLDARDALDPFGDWARMRALLARYGVDAIALNRRFAEVPALDYWTPRPEWFVEERGRLDRFPSAFERVYDRGDFVVYWVHRAALDTLRTPVASRPFVNRYRPGTDGIARRVAPGAPALLGFALSPRVAAPGDTVRGVIVWRAIERLPAGSYQIAVRFDRPLPGGFTPPACISKPLRKLIERLHHERYRFRADHLPVGGEYGVDLWTPDQAVRDSFSLVVPLDVANGDYQVQARMIRQPHYANLRLSDYFFDNDYFSGLPVGFFRVARRSVARRDVSEPRCYAAVLSAAGASMHPPRVEKPRPRAASEGEER
ncbi:MAG: hypothetical protein HYR73_04015 [Candidatus Eisenbacteria bacterium]|nr:hypothetical protein [Candidatus Eisenbacteria bacterium]